MWGNCQRLSDSRCDVDLNSPESPVRGCKRFYHYRMRKQLCVTARHIRRWFDMNSMPSRSVLLGLLFVSVLCAGCTSPQAPQSPTSTTGTDEPTPSTTTESTAVTDADTRTTGDTTDCPYYLQVDVATNSQLSQIDEVLEFSELPPARQREFEAALADGSVELSDTLSETWASPRIVNFSGEQYYTVAYVC